MYSKFLYIIKKARCRLFNFNGNSIKLCAPVSLNHLNSVNAKSSPKVVDSQKQSSRGVSCEKGVLTNFAIFTQKHLC